MYLIHVGCSLNLKTYKNKIPDNKNNSFARLFSAQNSRQNFTNIECYYHSSDLLT